MRSTGNAGSRQGPGMALASIALYCMASCASGPVSPGEGPIDAAELERLLRSEAARGKLPALAAGIGLPEGEATIAATGKIVEGGADLADASSRFNIGSTTKPMTALLVGILVEEGKLGWDWRLERALPGIAMREEYRTATIHDLLTNAAGIIAFQRTDLEAPEVVRKLWYEIPAASADPREQRRAVAEYALGLPPLAPPGTKHVYSNVGWAIAGHVAELAAGMPYEELLAERIFAPLGMKDSRIGGWPASEAEPDQPRGHYPAGLFSRPKPQELRDPYTFPDWMNPAGGANCSIADYARFAVESLRESRGEGRLLGSGASARIFGVEAEVDLSEMYPGSGFKGREKVGYAWAAVNTDSGEAFAADGTGGTFYARIVVLPRGERALALLCNAGGAEATMARLSRALLGARQIP